MDQNASPSAGSARTSDAVATSVVALPSRSATELTACPSAARSIELVTEAGALAPRLSRKGSE